jgi:nascent polypeptide-associated complex subunit alpha
MMPGMNPKQLQAMMKQLGIQNEEIATTRVIVEKEDGARLVVEPAQVVLIKMQGQKSLQVSGEIREESGNAQDKQSDAELVANETGCSKEEAEAALKETDGDLAEAILKLKDSKNDHE